MRSLILTGKLSTFCEFDYPYYRLQEEGEVEVAVRGKETVFAEIVGLGGLVQAGKIVPTMDVPDPLYSGAFDLLVLPGGAKAMEYMRQDKGILDFIAAFHATGGVIASICHAAQLLISAKLVKGRRISGYYSIRDDIENAGGTYIDAPSVTWDRIVTTAHYKHMASWMIAALVAVRREKALKDSR